MRVPNHITACNRFIRRKQIHPVKFAHFPNTSASSAQASRSLDGVDHDQLSRCIISCLTFTTVPTFSLSLCLFGILLSNRFECPWPWFNPPLVFEPALSQRTGRQRSSLFFFPFHHLRLSPSSLPVPGITLVPFPVMHILPVLSLLVSIIGLTSAQYTIYQPYQQVIFGGNTNTGTTTLTGTAAAATYTGSAAYDPTVLQPPPPPIPPVPSNQFVQLYSGGMNGLSIPHTGAFFGFSIEMSVVNHVRMYFLFLRVFIPPTLVLSLQWEGTAPCFRSHSSI